MMCGWVISLLLTCERRFIRARYCCVVMWSVISILLFVRIVFLYDVVDFEYFYWRIYDKGIPVFVVANINSVPILFIVCATLLDRVVIILEILVLLIMICNKKKYYLLIMNKPLFSCALHLNPVYLKSQFKIVLIINELVYLIVAFDVWKSGIFVILCIELKVLMIPFLVLCLKNVIFCRCQRLRHYYRFGNQLHCKNHGLLSDTICNHANPKFVPFLLWAKKRDLTNCSHHYLHSSLPLLRLPGLSLFIFFLCGINVQVSVV